MSGFRAPAAVAIVQHNQKLVDDPGDGEISEAPGSAHARLRRALWHLYRDCDMLPISQAGSGQVTSCFNAFGPWVSSQRIFTKRTSLTAHGLTKTAAPLP